MYMYKQNATCDEENLIITRSPHNTHRGRGDTYCKLVKPLKTPSGTLVSWFSDR